MVFFTLMKRLRSRIRTRKEKKMQELAFQEARAAGWSNYQEDEVSDEEEVIDFDKNPEELMLRSECWNHHTSASLDNHLKKSATRVVDDEEELIQFYPANTYEEFSTLPATVSPEAPTPTKSNRRNGSTNTNVSTKSSNSGNNCKHLFQRTNSSTSTLREKSTLVYANLTPITILDMSDSSTGSSDNDDEEDKNGLDNTDNNLALDRMLRVLHLASTKETSPRLPTPEQTMEVFAPVVQLTNVRSMDLVNRDTFLVESVSSEDCTESTVEMTEEYTERLGEMLEPCVMEKAKSIVSIVNVETLVDDITIENDNNNSSSEEENVVADDASLDLGGVSTSVWSTLRSQNESHISTLARGIFSPSDLLKRSNSFVESDSGGEDNYSVATELEGAGVFMAAEGARYCPPSGSPCRNDLFHIQDAEAGSSPLQHSGSLQTFQIEDEALIGGDESIRFLPRYDDDDEDNDMWNELKVVTKESPEKEYSDVDNTRSSLPKTPASCFGGSVQLISPDLFNEDASASGQDVISSTKTPTHVSIMSPLSSMVHPMDLTLFDFFDTNDDSSVSTSSVKTESVAGDSSITGPVDRMPCSIFLSDQHNISATDTKSRRRDLSTSFRSSTKTNRVAYRLNSGKKSMSRTERVYSKSFLPSKPVLNPADIPSTTKQLTNDRTLPILLVEMTQKIFEIVTVDINPDTTVGDVLAKARSVATDPSLSEQKYTSICYQNQDFGAPMLPVSLLIDWKKHVHRPLAVAVPLGCSATEMQAVKRVLCKNPKIQRWWKQQDPFRPNSKSKQSISTLEGQQQVVIS